MALGFSQGLLGGLRTFGQGGDMPADPNQRNVMQQYGVTNPLLQQFGQSVGMLVGRDMRSQADQLKGAYTGLDPSDPKSLLEVAKVVEKYDPVKAAELRAKAAEVVTSQKAAAATAQKDALNQQKTLAEINKLNAEAAKEGKENTGTWKAVGGDSGYIFNDMTGEKRWAGIGEEPSAAIGRKTDLTPDEKKSLKAAVQLKYKNAPEVLTAILNGIDANVIKTMANAKDVISDDDLAKIPTPEKLNAVKTDMRGELSKVARLRKIVDEGWLTTGFGSGAARMFGGTSATNAEAVIKSIQGSQAFKALIDLKSTGATLGQVSNVELQLLINEIEALSQDMSYDEFTRSLNNIEQRYKNMLGAMDGNLTELPIDGTDRVAYLSSTDTISFADKKGNYEEVRLEGDPAILNALNTQGLIEGKKIVGYASVGSRRFIKFSDGSIDYID